MSVQKLFTLSIALITLGTSSLAHAQASGSHGGDECERRIKSITQDIRSWILRGGSKGLQFQSDLNSSDYDAKMLSVINPILAKQADAAIIECTSEKVLVDNTEKTCRWFEGDQDRRIHIQCNTDRFYQVLEKGAPRRLADAQYRLVHHELAGIPAIEKNRDESSEYFYSDQIVSSLGDVLERKLVVAGELHEVVVPMTVDSGFDSGVRGVVTVNEDVIVRYGMGHINKHCTIFLNNGNVPYGILKAQSWLISKDGATTRENGPRPSEQAWMRSKYKSVSIGIESSLVKSIDCGVSSTFSGMNPLTYNEVRKLAGSKLTLDIKKVAQVLH